MKPFLRWAGGKQNLIKDLLKYLPPTEQVNRYFEPFLGAGSLFFATDFKKCFLSDINKDLMNCYRAIKKDPKLIAKSLERHNSNYQKDEKYYYKVRERFNEYLEEKYGVGFHTISVPRLKKAEGMSLEDFPHIITDEQFKRLVTILRLAVPYVGIILSTRESKEMRQELIDHGISQVSAGSKTDVGGYHDEDEEDKEPHQFQLSDERSVLEVMKDLIDHGYIPSYCTACYRKGRTGDRFMKLAKAGTIGLICEPNAIMTLTEYLMDYADDELKEKGLKFVIQHSKTIKDQTVKEKLKVNIDRIIKGERDLFF